MGVAHVINIMRAELEVTMALAGCRNLAAQLAPNLIDSTIECLGVLR